MNNNSHAVPQENAAAPYHNSGTEPLNQPTMDEDQEAIRVLFGQRLDNFYCSSGAFYTLANEIALMDDFPIDALNVEYRSFLHEMGGVKNKNLIETTLQIIRTLVERGNNINLDVRDKRLHRLCWKC